MWEAKYSEVYRKGVPTEELTSLYEEFIDSVASSSLIGKNLTMSRFRSFMVSLELKLFEIQHLLGYYPLAQQSCGGDIGSVPYVCM